MAVRQILKMVLHLVWIPFKLVGRFRLLVVEIDLPHVLQNVLEL